jgi:hypothetical protein
MRDLTVRSWAQEFEGKVWDIFAIQRCCYERPAMPVAAIQRITRLRAP